MYLAQHGIIIKELIQSHSGRPIPSAPAVDAASKPIDLVGVSDLPAFVSRLATAIGCRYTPNVSITFPYAGIQVRAVSNLIMADNGKELLVDFGDLYGDAVESIKRTGFHIVQIQKPVSFHALIENLLRELGVSYQHNPVFRAASRTGPFNTMLTVPGFLIENQGGSKILIALSALHDRLVQFIAERQIALVKIGPTE